MTSFVCKTAAVHFMHGNIHSQRFVVYRFRLQTSLIDAIVRMLLGVPVSYYMYVCGLIIIFMLFSDLSDQARQRMCCLNVPQEYAVQ